MKLSLKGLTNRADWDKAGIALPAFDVEKMREKTKNAPSWVHVGAGNIFRAFPCAALQRLLEAGQTDLGVIALETYDPEIVSRAYAPFDNLSLLCVLRADGQIGRRVIASVAEAVTTDEVGMTRMKTVFANPSLQMVTFTVTEKAYTKENPLMGLLSALLLHRYQTCGAPLAMVSLDNCAHNGDRLKAGLLPAAEVLVNEGKASAAFFSYIKENVSFPISMIDKITPYPDAGVADMLRRLGFEDTEVIRTAKGTATAAFVNAEEAEYLVIEDQFPNGRPPLEKAGVLFTDRETVDKVEKMKVGTCLNPLHTALAVLGCLLGFTKISAEMTDTDLVRFVQKLGFEESLPVVVDPGIISPQAFLTEVLSKRFPNPFLPDTPQRIATDTSAKLSVRFGWTIANTQDPSSLACVPFVFAAWLRYLSGIDDQGNAFTISPDPRLNEVQARLSGGLTDDLLRDASLFSADLVEIGLAPTVRRYYDEMSQGAGAVRRALKRVVEG